MKSHIWLSPASGKICAQLLVELADFTDKDFGGAPKGNKNARKKSRKAKESEDED